MNRYLTMTLLSCAFTCTANAAQVTVTMNSNSPTMSLVNKATGATVDVGEATSRKYTFEAEAGTYVLTGYNSNSGSAGTIEIDITDEAEQAFTMQTLLTYATNSGWEYGTDYTLNAKITAKTGETRVTTIGDSSTSGRKTVILQNGDSYYITFTPSEAHQNEGYMETYKSGTATNSITASIAIPMGEDFAITTPADAEFELGIKISHFLKFTTVEPKSVETNGDNKVYTYHLANSQIYNYRTWKSGGLTQAGYFTMSTDATKRPDGLTFTNADYQAYDAKTVNHDYSSNSGFETGNILVNINERGHLKLNVGDTYDAHAMRSWELTDNSTNNYFIEPDFHYTILDVNGKPSTGVIEIDNANTTTDPWSTIKAVGNGTAIVLVTYDAIGLNYYTTSGVKTPYSGGEYWGAIWPENTAAYVVTVGEGDSAVVPNMTINAGKNNTGSAVAKNAGDNVDAEFDVFYYLESEEGYNYTFTPQNAASVELAYPTIGEQMATYSGFGSEGVIKNEDGSYTLLLKQGRQIVRLTDASGNAVYQVLTAQPCQMEVINASREGSQIFQPGDDIKVQFSGLAHPANKLAGVYNMGAYTTYQTVSTGISLNKGTSNQYNFGNTPAAQAVSFAVPSDYAAETIELKDGAIFSTGYGDPYGNHRIMTRAAGRNANFTAGQYGAYFGILPEATIELTAVKNFTINITNSVSGAKYVVTQNGTEIAANADGTYTGTYGYYLVAASCAGYRYYQNTFNIADDAEGTQTFNVELTAAAEGTWDGTTLTEPAVVDGVYQISTGAELAWFANNVNTNKVYDSKGVLLNDIDLGDYAWTAIGGATLATAFTGSFDGQSHAVKGLYINDSSKTYQGLFGYVNGGSISNVSVYGEITAKQYIAGIAAYINNGATVDRCANYADLTAINTSSYIGGITGYINGAASTITNSYNIGNISGGSNCGGIAGNNLASSVITNVYNAGTVTGTSYVGGCVGGSALKTNVSNAYTTNTYTIASTNKGDNSVVVTDEQLASGEVAYKLGEAFGQEIGEDEYPVLGGTKVFYYSVTDTYYNGELSGVEDIATDSNATVAGYYDINGRRLSAPQRGLNIVVMSDGTVKKQIVK